MRNSATLLTVAVVLVLCAVAGLSLSRARSAEPPPQNPRPGSLQVIPVLVRLLYTDIDPPEFAPLNIAPSKSGIGRVVSDYNEAEAGRSDAAKADLQALVADQHAETRLRLFAAHILRRLGGTVVSDSPDIVRGVVLEVPVDGGTDLLGAYEDGTMRYFNAVTSGAFVESKSQPQLNAAAEELVALAGKVHEPNPIQKGEATMMLLTFGGNKRVGTSSPEAQSVFSRGAMALSELTANARQKP